MISNLNRNVITKKKEKEKKEEKRKIVKINQSFYTTLTISPTCHLGHLTVPAAKHTTGSCPHQAHPPITALPFPSLKWPHSSSPAGR